MFEPLVTDLMMDLKWVINNNELIESTVSLCIGIPLLTIIIVIIIIVIAVIKLIRGVKPIFRPGQLS